MEIILMRHGQPDLPRITRVSPRSMQQWISDYDRATITGLAPSSASLELAGQARQVVSSDLPRALASLDALRIAPHASEALFREAHLPHGRWAWPRFSPFTWAFILRLRWLCGFNGQGESARQARARAGQGAARLQDLALQGPVLLMGHGVMNRLIGQHLRARGWTLHRRDGSGYWSTTVYRMPAPQDSTSGA